MIVCCLIISSSTSKIISDSRFHVSSSSITESMPSGAQVGLWSFSLPLSPTRPAASFKASHVFVVNEVNHPRDDTFGRRADRVAPALCHSKMMLTGVAWFLPLVW